MTSGFISDSTSDIPCNCRFYITACVGRCGTTHRANEVVTAEEAPYVSSRVDANSEE